MKSHLALCTILALSPAAAFGQAFVIQSSASISSVVSPLPGGASEASQSFSDSRAIDLSFDSPLSTASSTAAAQFTADGTTARGFAGGAASASASLFGLTINGGVSASYPQEAPNSALGSQFFGHGAYASSGAISSLQIFDVVFSGPQSAVLGSINLDIGPLVNTWVGVSLYNQSGNFLPQALDGPYWTDSGGLFTSGNFVIPVGEAVRLYFDIGGGATVNPRFGDTDQNAAFGGTVSLPLTGDIFNLPDGYTVNAISAQIIDNRFTAVPEPSEYAMMGAFGLLGLAAARRHFARKAA